MHRRPAPRGYDHNGARSSPPAEGSSWVGDLGDVGIGMTVRLHPIPALRQVITPEQRVVFHHSCQMKDRSHLPDS